MPAVLTRVSAPVDPSCHCTGVFEKPTAHSHLTPAPTRSAGIAEATPIAHKGSNVGARVIAMTAIDVLRDPALVEEAWRYHREVQTKDYQWTSLIPEGTVARHGRVRVDEPTLNTG